MTESSFHVHDGPSDGGTHPTEVPSNRHFGLIVGGALALLTLAPLGWLPPDWVLLVVAIPLLTLALLLPRVLWLPNLLWMKLGMVIGRIVQFASLGVLFFGALTVVGAIMRLFGVDRLKNQIEPDLESYWEDHRQIDDAPADMRRQS
jgi:hypothetical protein